MLIINDSTPNDIVFPDPSLHARGGIPRDYSVQPLEMFDAPSSIPLIPRSEWQGIIEERKQKQSSLRDIWKRQAQKMGVSTRSLHLDQNGDGHCWAYSIGHTEMMVRARDNQEYVRLNPHFVATYLKRFNGGWCGLSAQVAREVGYLEQGNGPDQWPLHSNNTSLLNETRKQAAAKYKITEDWVDLTRPAWGQNLTYDQLITCLLMNIPCAVDFNWWSHSVCACDVEWRSGNALPVILNSWAGWGDDGFAVLEGNRAVPDGAVATRAVIMT
jgi:hypothetical protein